VSYTANVLNQYTAVGSVSPTYDGNGNLTSDGTYTFGYDAENRLTSASGAGTTATYAFDAQGRRKTKTVNGTTAVFVTDADNREVLEYDGTSGAIERWNTYALGPNDVLNQTNVTAGTRVALIPDIQGSIIGTQDSSSGVLSKIGYLPYGASIAAGPFGFTGQRVDVEIGGLYYYRARHYSPAWGRFVQVDPIGYQGGVHLYAYVRNDPLNLIDPSGLVMDSVGQAYATFAQGSAAEQQATTDYYNQHPLVLAATVASPFVATGAGAFAEYALGFGATVAVEGADSLVPSTLARVIPGGIPLSTLGPPGAADVFVTTPEAIEGLDAAGIAQKLTIPESPSGFQVLQFPTPEEGLASPVFRTNPGFVGGGYTAGGAPEFVIPNGPIPPGATIATVP
jgi:RHS repeat-associated protein